MKPKGRGCNEDKHFPVYNNEILINYFSMIFFYISEYILENSSTGELCTVFMKQVNSLSAWSQISNVHVTYKASGIESNIRIEKFPCPGDHNSYRQNVELILICQRKKGIGYQKVFEACCFYKTPNLCTFNLQDN